MPIKLSYYSCHTANILQSTNVLRFNGFQIRRLHVLVVSMQSDGHLLFFFFLNANY